MKSFCYSSSNYQFYLIFKTLIDFYVGILIHIDFKVFIEQNFSLLWWYSNASIYYWLHRKYRYQTFHRIYTQYFMVDFNHNINEDISFPFDNSIYFDTG